MPNRIPAQLRDASLAAVVGALAVVVRALAQPILGDSLPFAFAFPATVLASLLWGTVPGIIAAVVCAAGVAAPAIPPSMADSELPVQLGAFVITATITAALCGGLRGSPALTPPVTTDGPAETQLGVWLKAVLWAALFVPLSAFVAASWWSLDRAEAASEDSLTHASALAFRQAQRAFAVAEEIAVRADQASNIPGADSGSRAAELHQRLADMAAGLTSVVNANIWDATGAPLARSDRFPVDPDATISDRAYFQQQRASPLPVGVSEVMLGRLSGKELMNVTRRRSSDDGTFRGIVTVSLSPSFFRDYFQSLASDEPTLASFMLVRNDGVILAGWPDEAGGNKLRADDPVMKLLSGGAASSRMVVPGAAGRETRLVMVQHVGNAPVAVVTGLSKAAMLSNWARSVGILAAILLPTTAGLVYVTWVALRKTRREHAISAELQQEIRARAVNERKLLESQRLETLAFVTGGVAHDFNNLLAVISSSLHVYKKYVPEAADNKFLAAISRSVESGVRLTRQLLSFSRKQALRPQVVTLQTWLPSADALLRSTLGSGIEWISAVDPDTAPVRVDVGELELALINLVLNAKFAMPRGGRLSLHVSNDEEAPPGDPVVIFCVEDTGEGIPPAVLSRVFEPFFTTRQKGVGSGLGLSQVEGFCIQSGGRATIKSVVGEGTTICLHLPASKEHSDEPSRAPLKNAGNLDARLLLVEDNDEVGTTTEQMLRSSGVTVVRVASADAALAYLAEVPRVPDIVLSDIAMPGSMNGIGLALELRRLYPGLPVMLTTGYAEQMSQGTAKGMRVFQKPVPPEDLLAELRTLLDAARQGGGG